MRYQLQTTTPCGPLLTATLHVVVFTEPHDREPLCGTNLWSQRPSDAGPRAKFEKVARPRGVERADAINIRIPIEGADIGLLAEGA